MPSSPPADRGDQRLRRQRVGSRAARPRGRYPLAVSDRAFPVVYASDVAATAAFYKRFGFQKHFRQPPEGDAGGGATVFRKPQDMPWGERVAWVADPEGNPVALAEAPIKG